MPAPEVMSFGDEDHSVGATGLVIDGGGFGAFPGSAWIYENSDRTGNSDELTVGGWNDIQLTGVEIPGSPNNSPGTRYLFVQREDLAWSNGLEFSLSSSSGVGSLTSTLGALTGSAAGALEIQGTTNATLGALTASGAGALDIFGSLSQTLGTLALSSAGLVGNANSGSAAITLGALTSTAEGDLEIQGALTATLGSVTLSTRRSTNVRTSRIYRSPKRMVHRAA